MSTERSGVRWLLYLWK